MTTTEVCCLAWALGLTCGRREIGRDASCYGSIESSQTSCPRLTRTLSKTCNTPVESAFFSTAMKGWPIGPLRPSRPLQGRLWCLSVETWAWRLARRVGHVGTHGSGPAARTCTHNAFPSLRPGPQKTILNTCVRPSLRSKLRSSYAETSPVGGGGPEAAPF